MQKNIVKLVVLAFLAQVFVFGATLHAQASGAKALYPAMAPVNQYLMPDLDSEIALARSAAPRSISGAAEVMVLKRDGYTVAAKGKNGFVCIVERSWDASSGDLEFWNPKVRSPDCFNPPAARTYLPILLMKTKLVLAGKSMREIDQAIESSLDTNRLPALEAGAMSYMMSKRQYLNDQGKSWHPHLMFIVPGNVVKSSGANLPGSPLLASNVPENRLTILMVLVGKWSDGTPAPPVVN